MTISAARAREDWVLGKLVHDLDMQSNARMRERVASIGLTVAQASALYELDEPMTIGELAGRMSCEPSNATAIVDKLETLGFITRQPHPNDRRARILHPTVSGTAQRRRVHDVLRGAELITGLSSDERRTLASLLEKATTTGR